MTTRLVEFLDSLHAAARSAEPRLKTAKSYGGELDEGREEILAEQMPAVYSIVGRRQFANPTDPDSDSTVEVLLIVALRNLRSRAAALEGGAGGEPGMYDVLETLRRGLVGRRLPDNAAAPLGVTEWQAVGVTTDAAIYQMILAGDLVAV